MPVGIDVVIRILIESPNTAVQQGLTALCLTEPDIEVVDTAVSSSNSASPESTPDIALVDGQNMVYGLFHIQRLKQKYPQTRIVLLVSSLTSKTIWVAARAGAAGCIPKADSAHNLLQTLRSFHEQTV